jgi:hypothetical protein
MPTIVEDYTKNTSNIPPLSWPPERIQEKYFNLTNLTVITATQINFKDSSLASGATKYTIQYSLPPINSKYNM